MWKIYSLISLTYILSFLAAVAALLLTVSFTQRQRKRFPFLRKLDGKKLHLVIAAVFFSALAYSAYIYKEMVILNSSFEPIGPGGLKEKATPNGITHELRQSAAERAEEAEDFFNSGERDFQNKKYRQAADNYQQSLNITPTSSAYLNLALSLRYLSEYEEAERVLVPALQLARRRGQRKFEGLFLLTLGAVLIPQDKREEADDALRRSLEILTAVGDKLGEANARLDLGVNAHGLGKPDEALLRYQEALMLFQDMNNILGQANVLGNIGNVHVDRFNLLEAMAAHQSALEKFQKIDHPVGEVITIGNIGDVYNYQGRYQEALKKLQSAVEMAKKIENPEAEARLTATIGEIYIQQGRFDEALPLEEEALEIAGRIKTPYIQVHAHNRMADAYLGKGLLPKALEHAQSALDIISNNPKVYPYVQAETHNAFGEIYLRQKQTDNALRSFMKALNISAQVTSPKLRSLRGIGFTYSALGRKEDALTYLRQAQEIYKNAGVDSLDSKKVQDLIDKLADKNSFQE